jgi:mono/diheme cytochrome c family protein
VVAVAAVCVGGCFDKEPMDNQQKYRAWGENTFFTDGRAMRPLPDHVVPREAPVGEDVRTTGTVDGQFARTIPIPVDRALLDRGRHKFEIYCATCHGVLGDGDSLVAVNFPLRQPPSLIKPRSPGYIFNVATRGYGFMASYAHELSEDDRWAVVAYIEALRLSQSSRVAELPPRLQARFREGGGP